MDKKKTDTIPKSSETMNRRQALTKMGYAAFASTTMLLLLNNPTRANGSSLDPGGIGDDNLDDDKSFGGETQQKSNDPWLRDDDPWR